MRAPKVRTGQAPPKLDRAEFERRFLQSFADGAYRAEDEAIARLTAIAWDAYHQGRKSPETRRAGEEFHDPSYELSLEWLDTRQRIRRAEERQRSTDSPTRYLLVNGSSRNDGTCPSENSKSHRLVEIAREALLAEGAGKGGTAHELAIEVDVLDLSLLSSEYGRNIHPCKACVSTAMPLCHWPCSCYPNHGLGQTHDWMNEIYQRFTAAHGVVFVTPVYWYQSPSPLKLLIDRLVCADGGNPDPTSTHGKKPEEAKAIELRGWDYPQHLSGRAYGVLVHGDAAGAESLRRSLSDWCETMGFVPAGEQSKIDRYIGYYEPYATSHDALDRDTAIQEEARHVALAVASTTRSLRKGTQPQGDDGLSRVRPK